MRAGMVLRLLARQYRVSLLVVRLYAPLHGPIPAAVAEVCAEAVALPVQLADPGRSSPSRSGLDRLRGLIGRGSLGRAGQGVDRIAAAARAFRGREFDVLHVFRLAMMPFARPYVARARSSTRRHVDLDDVESITRRRLAELYRAGGRATLADFEEEAAGRAAILEAEVLRDFDRVYVCSEQDQAVLARPARAQVCVLPNALPVPDPLPPPPSGQPFTFLFVGTLGYYPNEEGIVYFCTQVLPLIRQASQRDVRVLVVGPGASPAIQGVARARDVTLIGPVPEVRTLYREADAVVVPIRAGGGTRIKVLEAFSYRRPVVATTLGVEGIAAQPGEHFLRGDTPTELADACLCLLTSPPLAERLADNAYALFCHAYTIEAASDCLAVCAGNAETSRRR
jgi:glycosyltransferase involved in cell wall biosynthesis